ncbi:MAG: hypothetical protein KDD36_14805 [Flavobacteriales bacterium]|nr:hypothetical protein [Flavobacteriales bacterium]
MKLHLLLLSILIVICSGNAYGQEGDPTSDSLNTKMQGFWRHDKDSTCFVRIDQTQWMFVNYGTPVGHTFDMHFTETMPRFADTNSPGHFMFLTQVTDTLFYELLGPTDTTLSLMHFPSGRIHLYHKDKDHYPLYLTEIKTAFLDSTINPYFMETFKQQQLVHHRNDNQMLEITDSLFSMDPDKQLFYFLVFTRSLNGADGFYAEGAGLAAHEFVTTRTIDFASYFAMAPGLREEDLALWADQVLGELTTSHEGHEREALNQLNVKLRGNINATGPEIHAIVDSFINIMNKLSADYGF